MVANNGSNTTLRPVKRMSSGQYIDMGNFTSDDVRMEDIEVSLNHIYRFTGHHKDKVPLTVAQHSYMVWMLACKLFPDEPNVQLAAIMHDWPEAYYGDMATPWKKILGDHLRKLQAVFDHAVFDALWLHQYKYDDEVHDKVKMCDLIALDIERRNMWKSQLGKDKWPVSPEIGLTLQQKEEWFDDAQSIQYVNLSGIRDMYNPSELVQYA